MNVYSDPWLVAANAAIMEARATGTVLPARLGHVRHGTITGYRAGCRCDECTRRESERNKRYGRIRRARERQQRGDQR